MFWEKEVFSEGRLVEGSKLPQARLTWFPIPSSLPPLRRDSLEVPTIHLRRRTETFPEQHTEQLGLNREHLGILWYTFGAAD